LGFAKAFTKCGDFIYSGTATGYKDKTVAFGSYKKAAELGDPLACN